MNWIVAKKNISGNIVKLDIKASEIAFVREPGHHVIVRITRESEPLPMVIARVNRDRGLITLFVHKIGSVHRQLANMSVGEELYNISGPYGVPVNAEKTGTVLCAAGGVGIAPLCPVTEAMKKAGNRVISVIGARTADYLILDEEIRRFSDELIIMTDDGSLGEKGMVTDGMQKIFIRERINHVITYGPARMIKHSTILTRKYSIPLVATLYSMKVDNNGINGIYRVSVCGESKYICVDGIDFNAYYPDFDTMISRMGTRFHDEYSGNQLYMEPQLAIV